MLDFIVDSLDGMDEATQKLYKPLGSTGKFQLQVKGLPEPEDASAELQTALQDERRTVASQKTELRKWKALGANPDEVKETIAELKTTKSGDEDAQKLLDQQKTLHDAEVAKLTGERDAALKGEKSAIVDNNLKTSFIEAGFNPEGLDLLSERYAGRVQVEVGDDGTRNLSILTPEMDAPMIGTGKGNRAVFADLAKEAAEKYPMLLTSTRKGGDGKDPNGGKNDTGKTMSRSDWDALPPDQQQAKITDGFTLTDE